MKTIGTMVIANDGFGTRLGQIADHMTDRWGTHHVVLIGGKFENVDHIMDADGKGIGWKVATQAEILRAQKYAAHERNMAD
jgi:hypothetical protein